MNDCFDKVETLRRDDHRDCHRCRINQTLHFARAISLPVAYEMLLRLSATAGLIDWRVGRVTRQSGHILFEPRGHGRLHGCDDTSKESIKVGYNM